MLGDDLGWVGLESVHSLQAVTINFIEIVDLVELLTA